ncbi:Sterile alpha motif domain containing 7, partial [Coemansia sp. RSA 922]
MALSPSPPPPAAAASTEQQPPTDLASMPPQLPHPPTDFVPPPQLPHSPPDTTSTPTSQGSEALPLPANAQRWSVDDVHRWAAGQALLAPVAGVLRQHAVDGHVLLNYVTNTILGEELGIAAFGTRVHVLEAIEMLRWRLGKDKPGQEKDRSLSPASSAPLSDSRSRS